MAVDTKVIEGMRVGDLWNIKPVEYTITGNSNVLDFQDLMVNIAEQRATAIESEVAPLANRIKKRNERLEYCGKILSTLSACQYNTKDDANPRSEVEITLSAEQCQFLYDLGDKSWTADERTNGYKNKLHKEYCDLDKRLLQTEIDKLNNEAQLDMNRMQSLVDHRDQSYNTATTLMQHISECRGTTIKGMS